MKRLGMLCVLAAFALAACDSPQRTVEQLRAEIAAYKATPTDEAQEKIEASLEKLEAQIDELEAKGRTAEAANLRASEQNLRADYRAARMIRTMKDAQSAIEGIGNAFKEAGRSIGEAFRELKEPEDPDSTSE